MKNNNINRKIKINQILMKENIILFLQEKNSYNIGYDYLIDLIVDQFELYLLAREQIRIEGLSVFGSSDKSFTVRNQNFKTLQECISNIDKLSKKLCLSVDDLQVFKKLNESKNEEDDGFEDFNS